VTGRLAGPLAAVALVGLLAGCAGSATPNAPAGPAAPAPAPAPAPALMPAAPPAAGTPDATACADNATTVSTVRGIADALERGPVLPAGVTLFLMTPREKAAAPEVTDPRLRAARAEMVAAIDDLDAQGQALLPPGGDALRDPVQLNPARILAAVAELEHLCGN
jgi:hypothetical protein